MHPFGNNIPDVQHPYRHATPNKENVDSYLMEQHMFARAADAQQVIERP